MKKIIREIILKFLKTLLKSKRFQYYFISSLKTFKNQKKINVFIEELRVICLHKLNYEVSISAENSGEKFVLEMISKYYINKEIIIFDVGANEGQYLNLVTSIFDENKFYLHCFEPQKSVFLNLQKFNDSNTSLINCGLGSEVGSKTLNIPKINTIASYVDANLKHWDLDDKDLKQETTKIDTVDNYCKSNKITKINLF